MLGANVQSVKCHPSNSFDFVNQFRLIQLTLLSNFIEELNVLHISQDSHNSLMFGLFSSNFLRQGIFDWHCFRAGLLR